MNKVIKLTPAILDKMIDDCIRESLDSEVITENKNHRANRLTKDILYVLIKEVIEEQSNFDMLLEAPTANTSTTPPLTK